MNEILFRAFWRQTLWGIPMILGSCGWLAYYTVLVFFSFRISVVLIFDFYSGSFYLLYLYWIV